MSEDLERAVEAFLDHYDSAREDYEKGYADADATVRVIDTGVAELRAALDESE